MESTSQGWVAPDAVDPSGIPPAPRSNRFNTSAPLGGTAPAVADVERPSMARDLAVAAVLLVASVLTGLSTLMSWRDYGPGLDPDESGWRYADGSLGRGWIAIIVAICLAVGGVLLVSGRRSAGRRWARVGSAALIVMPVLEWTLGDVGSRSGPGLGLWVLLGLGITLMVLLGTVLPADESDGAGALAGRSV